jgi:hypothetical protein
MALKMDHILCFETELNFMRWNPGCSGVTGGTEHSDVLNKTSLILPAVRRKVAIMEIQ